MESGGMKIMNGVSISTLLYFGVKALSSAIPVILFVFLLLVLYQVLRLFGFFQKGNQTAAPAASNKMKILRNHRFGYSD